MNAKKMRISVAMATYNGEKFIRQQLDSILKQTIQPDEIVISDDGSKDSTLDIIKEFQRKNPKIILVYNTRNHGADGNFANAFSNTTGDLIFPSDQDDLWEINKIELMYKEFTNDIDIVYAQDEIFDENGFIANTSWRIPPIHKAMWKNTLAGHACAFRKDVLNKYVPSRKLSWDYEICLYSSVKGKVKGINDICVHWRRHSNTLTSQNPTVQVDLPTNKYAKLWYAIMQSIKGEYSITFFEYMQARKTFIRSIGGGHSITISILSHQKWFSFIIAGIVYACLELIKYKPKSLRDMLGHAAWAFCYPAVFWCEMRKLTYIT